MRMCCPACHAELSLEVILSHEAARQAVARLAAVSLPFGALTLRYMALFRPEKRGLSIERMVRLIDELLPDIERRAITRKGRDWDAPVEAWRAAIEVVLNKRDKATLTLPLTSHGLLYEVLAGLAEKVEARAEADQEQQRRQRRTTGADTGPRDLSDVAHDLGTASAGAAVVPAIAPPRPGYAGPSRAAREKRAEIEAALRRHQAGAGSSEDPPQGATA
ncbi:MAG: hypothetical protein Q8R98_01860 [Rubrivivax sp.]|nr:hypothetical protein [Rubrivivax sp.]MDP3610576.1 hypothetical protein [Rubrivivax sp.]